MCPGPAAGPDTGGAVRLVVVEAGPALPHCPAAAAAPGQAGHWLVIVDGQHPARVVQTLHIPRRVPGTPVYVPQHLVVLGHVTGLHILRPGQSEAVLEEEEVPEVPAVVRAVEGEVRHEVRPVCVMCRHDDLVSVVDSNILVSVIRFSTFDISNSFYTT